MELTEKFLAQIAGWEAMKQARALVQSGAVLSSNWTPPLLRGVAQQGEISYRAGLVIKSSVDIENVCHCRQSRESGTMCAHSIAVGLHFLKPPAEVNSPQQKQNDNSSPKSFPAKPSRRIQREEGGEPAELFVIFPPNLSQALDRGKIMVCFEVKWNRGRTLLNALPLSTAFKFSPADEMLLVRLETISPAEIPAMSLFTSEQLAELLPALSNHPRLTIGKSEALRVLHEPLRLKLRAKLESSGEISLALNKENVSGKIISGASVWIYQQGIFQPLSKSAAEILSAGGSVNLPRNRVPQFLSQDWTALQNSCEVEANFALEDFSLAPQPPEFLLHLAGGLAQLHAQLQCGYGSRIMTMGVTSSDEALWIPDPKNPTRYSTRDLAAEQNALGRLLRSGFSGPDAQGRYQLLGQNAVLNFFAREFPRLQKEWKVTLEERLQHSTTKNLEWVEPQFQVTSSGVQWFDLNVSFASHSGERFSPAEIQRLVLSGQSHTR
ncbi:MAG: SNF2 helicase associated domain-containing protein, partial [Verrucomicrobiota bacterium]